MHYRLPTFNALFPEPWMRKKHAFNALVCYLGGDAGNVERKKSKENKTSQVATQALSMRIFSAFHTRPLKARMVCTSYSA